MPALLALLAALLAGPAPATAQGEGEIRALTQKVDRLQRELTTLQRQVYRGGGDGDSAASGSGDAGSQGGMSQAAAARLNSRLSSLEQTIRDLTGRLEETQYQVRQLAQRLDKLSNDVDYRLSRLEEQAGLAQGQQNGGGGGQSGSDGPQQLAQGGEEAADGGASGDREQDRAGGQQQAARGSGDGGRPASGNGTSADGDGGQSASGGGQGGSQTLGQVSQQAVEQIRRNRLQTGESGGSDAQSADGGSGAAAGEGQQDGDGQAGETQTARAQPGDYELPDGSPAEQYEHAFSLLRQADYDKAERALAAFLKAHPDHELAGNAKYWLGETYYVRGNYSQAAVTFAEGFKNYADSSKAPDNLLKLGMSLAQIDRTEDACGIFAELLDRFPDAPNNIRQRAKREQQRLECGS